MTSAEDRNQQIHDLLVSLFQEAKTSEGAFDTPFTSEDVEKLFNSHIWGHREITLTIILARMIDSSFRASEDFYACNPRSIFEKPIRSFLLELGIPCKKSGPLNVAKNVQKINADWAKNKQGDDLAMTVVKLVNSIESASQEELHKFAVSFISRYAQEAGKVEKLKFEPEENEDPLFLANLCNALIGEVPDGGTTPQIICGLLIEISNLDRDSNVEVTGHRDSVSTTNTTSKKAGDVIENIADKSTFVYEITVKPFDSSRLRESFEAIKSFESNNRIRDIYVICRLEDIPSELSNPRPSYLLGALEYEDLMYWFIDIEEWILQQLLFLTPDGRKRFYQELTDHVNNINTSEKVKLYFANWHRENAEGAS